MEAENIASLPQTINIYNLEALTNYQGVWSAQFFTRLANAVLKVDDVQANFNCTKLNNEIMLQGYAAAVITHPCHRCNKPMQYNLTTEFNLQVCTSKQANFDGPTPDHEGNINIIETIEDELLINLPQVSTHDISVCEVGDLQTFGEIANVAEQKNPFEELKNLFKK